MGVGVGVAAPEGLHAASNAASATISAATSAVIPRHPSRLMRMLSVLNRAYCFRLTLAQTSAGAQKKGTFFGGAGIAEKTEADGRQEWHPSVVVRRVIFAS